MTPTLFCIFFNDLPFEEDLALYLNMQFSIPFIQERFVPSLIEIWPASSGEEDFFKKISMYFNCFSIISPWEGGVTLHLNNF
jgi:hypothetical protein